jgi:hypothetical protein
LKLTFDLANPAHAVAGPSISAREFLGLEGVACPSKGRPNAALASPESFEEALKNLVAALLNADPKEASVWTEVLTKQVGSYAAHRAFERLAG